MSTRRATRNTRETEQQRRHRLQQRNADFNKRQTQRKPDWLKQKEDGRRESLQLERQHRRRRLDDGEWVTNGGIRFHHIENDKKMPFIEGISNTFGTLDSDSEPENLAPEAFPVLPSGPLPEPPKVLKGWSDAVKQENKPIPLPSPPSPPKLVRSVGDLPPVVHTPPAPVCAPKSDLLRAPRKTLDPVRWGDDSESDDDFEPAEYSPTARVFGDGAW